MHFKSQWCAFAILYEISSGKIIMVIDADKPKPKLRKFPGGTHDPGDWKPENTALRELGDEIPQIEFKSQLTPIAKYNLGSHIKHFYFAKVRQIGKLEAVSDEIDNISKFTPAEVEEMINSGEVVKDHAKAWRKFEESLVAA